MDTINEAAGNKLVDTVKSIVQDAEKVLENSTTQGTENYRKAKEKLEATLKDVKYAVREWEEIVINKTKNAAICTADYAREHPWQTAGVVCAIGILIGVLIARR